MRLATITNWAYGATMFLTMVSAGAMLMASGAQDRERTAVLQRIQLDQASSRLGSEVFSLSDHAREYVSTGEPSHLLAYKREAAALGSVEDRIRRLKDVGASKDELDSLAAAIRSADTLHDEQRGALALQERGYSDRARHILFGTEYRLDLDRVANMIERFQYRLDQRTDSEMSTATRVARMWKACSEIVLGLTGVLFLCVLYFVFKRRVLHPVVRLSDVVGRLAAQDYGVEPPDYGQIDEIGDMAHAIGVFRENGLERQRLESERAADQALRALLSRMTQRMQGCETMHDLERVIEHFVPLIATGLAGRLYLLDSSRGAMVERCSWQSPAHSRAEFSPMSCWALQRGDLHRPGGAVVDMPCDHIDADGAGTIDSICLPLTAQRITVGLLYLEPRSNLTNQVADTPESYLKLLAENIGLAVGNLRLRDALRDMAMVDPLTGLANRRQLEIALDAQYAEASQLDRPISCLMLDVDHFKRVNDSFGHEAGDSVLHEMGEILKHSTRESGLAFRYGGEEFLLLLPGVGAEQAVLRAEDIRMRIQALDIQHLGRTLGPITASVGIASCPLHCALEQLVRTADAALLRAKAAGRDRVVVASSRQTDERSVGTVS